MEKNKTKMRMLPKQKFIKLSHYIEKTLMKVVYLARPDFRGCRNKSYKKQNCD